MGGFGSGWHGGCGRPRRKRRVTECPFVLDVRELHRRGLFDAGNVNGSIEWPDTARMGFKTEGMSSGMPQLVLNYWAGVSDGPGEDIEELIALESGSNNLGGQRWWLRCPRCYRRCYKLYIPPGRTRFACRPCYKLSYVSVQRHDPRESWFRSHPEVVAQLIGETVHALKLGRMPNANRLGLALRALESP